MGQKLAKHPFIPPLGPLKVRFVIQIVHSNVYIFSYSLYIPSIAMCMKICVYIAMCIFFPIAISRSELCYWLYFCGQECQAGLATLTASQFWKKKQIKQQLKIWNFKIWDFENLEFGKFQKFEISRFENLETWDF